MKSWLFLVAMAGLCPAASLADVMEWGADGKLIVPVAEDAASPREAAPRSGPLSPSKNEYRALAEQVALRHAGGPGPRAAGLDATSFSDLFVAMIRQESGFNPRAVSPVGAQGLGQLMPDTARLLGVRDPFNPEENLDGAARYLTAQLSRFGDVRLALAAYNAGPLRVEQYGDVPPFRETRDYVAKITAAVGMQPQPTADLARRPAVVTPASAPLKQAKETGVWEY